MGKREVSFMAAGGGGCLGVRGKTLIEDFDLFSFCSSVLFFNPFQKFEIIFFP